MSSAKKRSADGRPKPYTLLGSFFLVLFTLYLTAIAIADEGLSPKLGIDLQGGTRVTLIPIGDPSQDQLELAQNIIRDRVNGLGVAGTSVVIDGDNIVLTVPGEDSSQARDLGTTAQLSIRPVVEMVPDATPPESIDVPQGDREAMAEAIDEALEFRQSEDPAELVGRLEEFRCPDRNILTGQDDPKQSFMTCGEGAKYVLGPVPVLQGEPEDSDQLLDGQEIEQNSVNTGLNQAGQVEVSFRFSAGGDSRGSLTWSALTQEYLNEQIAILIDGEVISAPVVQGVTPPGQATSITGDFTMEEAQTLAGNLRYGALPVAFEEPNVDNVPASLGLASLEAGLLAGAVGMLLILVYKVFYYRLLGLLSFIGLVLTAALTYGMLVLLGYWIDFTLDLAGVAGLIIGIAMTADSSIVFFERVKDELRDGHRFRSAVPRGWKSAARTIVTGNAVSIIGAAVLYTLAIGEVRGFAFTLGLTTIMDLFVAFTVVWPIVFLASTKAFFTKPSVNGMGRMESLRAEAAERHRREKEIRNRAEKDAESAKGVEA